LLIYFSCKEKKSEHFLLLYRKKETVKEKTLECKQKQQAA
jgi:hypothetical protein